MLKRILNGQSSTITSAAIIIAGASFVSRLIGLARDRILAHYFGAGPIIDAYYASFKIPDLVYNLLIAGALTAGFIPTFTKLFDLGDDKHPAWDLASNIINILGLALIFLCGLGIIFAAPLAVIIAPGFAPANQALVISLTRIMFLSHSGKTIIILQLRSVVMKIVSIKEQKNPSQLSAKRRKKNENWNIEMFNM